MVENGGRGGYNMAEKPIDMYLIEDHMLDWHSCQICYPLEIKIIIIIIKY